MIEIRIPNHVHSKTQASTTTDQNIYQFSKQQKRYTRRYNFVNVQRTKDIILNIVFLHYYEVIYNHLCMEILFSGVQCSFLHYKRKLKNNTSM